MKSLFCNFVTQELQHATGAGKKFDFPTSLYQFHIYDLVIVTKMRRVYFEDGQERVGKLGNVYFHCRADCVKKKQPLFLGESVTIAPNIQDLLTPAHQQTIRTLVAG